MIFTCRNGRDPAPFADFGLMLPGTAGRDDHAVFLQADAVPCSRLDGGDVRPAADVKLTFVVAALAFHRPVGIQH